MFSRVLDSFASWRVSDWIGLYGAFLSSTLAIAQVVRAVQRRRGVKVKIQRGQVGTLGARDWQDMVRISVINRRDYSIRAVSFALEPIQPFRRKKSGWFLGSLPPADVRPHDRVDQTIAIDKLRSAGIDLSRRLRAVVVLTTDETFRSSSVILEAPDK